MNKCISKGTSTNAHAQQKVCILGMQKVDPADSTPITIFMVPAELPHSHPPNIDENIAYQLATSIKKKQRNILNSHQHNYYGLKFRVYLIKF